MSSADTYANLKQAIADFMETPEVEQTTALFIKSAEAQFNRDLRVPQMIVRKVTESDQQYVALPEDWLEAKNIQINVDDVPHALAYVPLEDADRLRAQGASGDVRYYSYAGQQLELLPTPSANVEIEMAYYRAIPALSDAQTTNWLLARAPDLYLYASLFHAAVYINRMDRAAPFDSMAKGIIARLNDEAKSSQVSGSALIRRVKSFG